MKSNTAVIIAAGLLALPAALQAQPIIGGHYPAGAEGLKGASLPPPGLYLRDYNFFYTADNYEDVTSDFDMFAYVNAARLIWITDWKILGADYGMDVIVPYGYIDWEVNSGGSRSDAGIGDIQIEPLLLSWHRDCYDAAVGYAVWAPTGDFRIGTPDVLAKGFWSHMLTAGLTWYLDTDKTWSLSLLNRYEFAHEQDDTNIDPGQVYTLDFGLGKTINDSFEVGIAGYYQQQTTEDDGVSADTERDRRLGIGPEISGTCPVTGINASLRYAYEFAASERPEGHQFVLTLTKPF